MNLHWQILVALGLGAKRNWHIFIALILGGVFGVLAVLTKTERNESLVRC